MVGIESQSVVKKTSSPFSLNCFYLTHSTSQLVPISSPDLVPVTWVFARSFPFSSFLVFLQSIGWLLSSFIRAVVDWLVGHKSTISIGFGDW